MSADRPGWGHPHQHEFIEVKVIYDVHIERCVCGQVRHVIVVDVEQDTGGAA